MSNSWRATCLGLIALAVITPSGAQYFYDPSHADEQTPGVRYFGSAKDDNGALLPGVSVVLDSQQWAYVLNTDEQGRFHINLPLAALTTKVSTKCAKPGFELVRVTSRPGPQGAPKPTVQVDCVLRRHAPNGAPARP
jgi:hypothetical protein